MRIVAADTAQFVGPLALAETPTRVHLFDSANELGVATDTVKSHVRNIMDKLTLHSRLEIAAYAHHQDQAS